MTTTLEAIQQTVNTFGCTPKQTRDLFEKNRQGLLKMAARAKAKGPNGKAGGNTELWWRIAAATHGTMPFTRQRNKALASVQWRLREQSGWYIGVATDGATIMAERDDALVFDGRDSETTKIKFFSALTTGKFHVECV